MAYKFQMGAAKMSGSLEQEGPINIDATVASQNLLQIAGTTVIDNSRNLAAVAVSGSSFFDVKKDKLRIQGIAVETTAQELNLLDAAVGNTVVNDRAVIYGGSGQIAATELSASSTLKVGGTVRFDGVVDDTVDVAFDSFYFLDAGDSLMKSERMTSYAAAIAGDGLAAASGVLEVGVDDSSIELNSDALRVKASGIATAMVADNAVTLAKMAGITRGSIIVGDSNGDPSALAKGTTGQFAVSDGDDIIYRSLSGDATLGADGALTIADDAVGADQLASNAVVTDSIVDNAVTLAKMAGLARGKIIVGDSSGDPSALSVGSAHQFFQSDGTDAAWVSMSGDVALAAGVATIQAGAVEHGMLAENIISGQNALGGASVAQADLLMLDDGPGAVKKVTFSNFEDSIFGNISGDALVAAGGALTIQPNAVEGSMLNNDVISAQTELASDGLAAADEFMISDAGTLKKIGVDNLFKDGPGLLTAATINVAADHFMFLDNGATGDAKTESIVDLVSAMAGAGLTATNGVLSTDGGSVTDWGAGENRTLSEGFNFRDAAALVSNQDLQLPGAVAPSIGDVVHVKAPADMGGFDLTISCYANQTVDGHTSIELESGGAAVSMVYLTSGSWGIF